MAPVSETPCRSSAGRHEDECEREAGGRERREALDAVAARAAHAELSAEANEPAL